MRSVLAAALLCAGSAMAQTPAIDFSGVQEDLAGDPTQVLVLGTVHINQQPEEQFPLEHLNLLLTRLEEWQPDLIAIENLSGETCHILKTYEQVYPGVWDRYCWDVEPALRSLGMSAPEATFALWELLDEAGDEPTAAQRRRLAALFWATGNPYSAVLQWYGLPEAERTASDGVDEALKERIERATQSRNESNVIAAVLAHRLGLAELHPMDDHTADRVIVRAKENPYPVLSSEVWGQAAPEARAYYEQGLAMLGSSEGVLRAYRHLNSPLAQRYTIDADFGGAAAHNEVTRQYVAWWQARGLRMAANVIEAAGNDPGAKVLVIVGASHKAYFDAYLDQMHDIELISVDEVLHD